MKGLHFCIFTRLKRLQSWLTSMRRRHKIITMDMLLGESSGWRGILLLTQQKDQAWSLRVDPSKDPRVNLKEQDQMKCMRTQNSDVHSIPSRTTAPTRHSHCLFPGSTSTRIVERAHQMAFIQHLRSTGKNRECKYIKQFSIQAHVTTHRDGDTYCGKWAYHEHQKCWQGNPVQSAEVQDLIQSIKHKVNTDRSVRTHSVAMSKEFMDQIHVWAIEQLQPLSDKSRSYTDIIKDLLLGSHTAPVEFSLEEHTHLTRMLEMLAFSTVAWNLWTRCFELVKLKWKDLTIAPMPVHDVLMKYLGHQGLSSSDRLVSFEIFLSNQKGWQQRVDKGKETDLRCKSASFKLLVDPCTR
jgi:hypothetical protein